MGCIDPILVIDGPKGRVYRNYSLSSPAYRSAHSSVLDCGRCITCRKKRARELAMRCVLNASLHEESCFLTLTYDEKVEGYRNTLDYPHIQKFTKKLRNEFRIFYSDIQTRKKKAFYAKKIQVFNVHEYGAHGKKHWHLLVFGHQFKDKEKFKNNKGQTLYTSKTLGRLWPRGHHTIGDVSLASAMYQAQYNLKDFKNGNVTNNKKSKSQHRGLGRDYFLKHYKQILTLGYVPFEGQKMPVPRYFEKIAKKHYSHFYEKDNFRDVEGRKRLFTPFKNDDFAIKELADLWLNYKRKKDEQTKEKEEEFKKKIEPYLSKKGLADFEKSGANKIYDLGNKQLTGEF